MTISSTARRAGPFLGNDSATAFAFTFKVFSTSDITVTTADSAAVETTLVLDTDYTVTLNANQDTSPGGVVTYPISGSALPTGARLTITGNLPYDQPLDIPAGGNFNPVTIENEFDRIVMQVQQLREVADRSITASVTSSVSGELPVPQAGRLLGWDQSNTAIVNYSIEELTGTAAYATWVYDTFTGNGVKKVYALQKSPGNIANCDVSVDGQTLVPITDFTVSGSTLTFVTAPRSGAEILVRYGSAAPQGTYAIETERKVATAGQTVVTLTELTYIPGANNISVYLNGARMSAGIDFTETSSTSITFESALSLNDEIVCVVGNEVAQAVGSQNVGFLQNGTGAVSRDVQSVLRERVSVKDFGAVGDGATDDTAAIQAAINEAMKTGKTVFIPGPGLYLISAPLVVKITRDADATNITPPSNVHFTDCTPAYIYGSGMPTIKATASMSKMIELIFDVDDSDIGPFYSKIEGLGFNGNNLAVTGIVSNYTMHNSIERNRFWNLTEGIKYTGYGVANISENTIRATYGIRFVGGGGDSLISANDFYSPQTGNSACILLEYYGGNTKIYGNVFTNEFGSAYLSYGVQLLGSTAPNSEEIRDVTIDSNEFCGLSTAIRADGKSDAIKNIYRILVSSNKTLPYSAMNVGNLLAAVNCQEININNNYCNSSALIEATGIAIELVKCQKCFITDNSIQNYASLVISLTNCTDTQILSNMVINCAKTGTSYVGVALYGASSARNYFKNNYFRQESASYGQYCILEDTGVDYTYSFDNTFFNFDRPHTKVGSNSVMRRTEYFSAIPTTGSYYVGDIVWNTSPSAGGSPGWICTTSGVNTFVFKAMSNLGA